MKRDPNPHDCVGCGCRLSGPNNYVCNRCVKIAAQLGHEISGFQHPGNEIARLLWERRNAPTP